MRQSSTSHTAVDKRERKGIYLARFRKLIDFIHCTELRYGTHTGESGGHSGNTDFVGSRSFLSICVPTAFVPVIVCVG